MKDPHLTTVPHAQDEATAALAELARYIVATANQSQTIAAARKKLFDAHVEAGFTEDQALELCKKLTLTGDPL